MPSDRRNQRYPRSPANGYGQSFDRPGASRPAGESVPSGGRKIPGMERSCEGVAALPLDTVKFRGICLNRQPAIRNHLRADARPRPDDERVRPGILNTAPEPTSNPWTSRYGGAPYDTDAASLRTASPWGRRSTATIRPIRIPQAPSMIPDAAGSALRWRGAFRLASPPAPQWHQN